MQVITPSRTAPLDHPIRQMARFVDANAWPLQHSSESEISFEISGRWSVYSITFAWLDGQAALHVNVHLDIFIVDRQMDEARKAINSINNEMWLGHFGLIEDTGMVVFRHILPLRGTGGATPEQIEDILQRTLGECERAYSALHEVSTGIESASTAVEKAMLETAGSA